MLLNGKHQRHTTASWYTILLTWRSAKIELGAVIGNKIIVLKLTSRNVYNTRYMNTCSQITVSPKRSDWQFLLHIGSQWDNNDENHFMQDGATQHFALPVRVCVCVCVCVCVTWQSFFLAGGLGVEDQRNALRDVPVLLRVFFVVELGQDLGLQIRTENTW